MEKSSIQPNLTHKGQYGLGWGQLVWPNNNNNNNNNNIYNIFIQLLELLFNKWLQYAQLRLYSNFIQINQFSKYQYKSN